MIKIIEKEINGIKISIETISSYKYGGYTIGAREGILEGKGFLRYIEAVRNENWGALKECGLDKICFVNDLKREGVISSEERDKIIKEFGCDSWI